MVCDESWGLTEGIIIHVTIRERKILRKIYGPVQEKASWIIRTNREVQELYKNSYITDTKARRNEWLVHVSNVKRNRILTVILD
jgi:hypothetical protein